MGGIRPSVRIKRRKSGHFFPIFVIFCLQLLWLFYFFKYLNHFLWTFKKNFLFSDKFRAFLFLQLRKILPSWPGIRTNVHERTDIFGNFVYIFWKAMFETKDIYFLDRRPPAGLGRKVVSVLHIMLHLCISNADFLFIYFLFIKSGKFEQVFRASVFPFSVI